MRIALSICSLIFLNACSADQYVLETEGAAFCIPNQYVVQLKDANLPSGQYDSEDGGYEISLMFSAEELAKSVGGYRPVALDPGVSGTQPMYVMLSKLTAQGGGASVPPAAKPLDETSRLLRLDTDAIAWQVGEKAEAGYVSWGHCTDLFDASNSYDCIRDLRADSLTLSYAVHKSNLPVYQDIDSYLTGKLERWACRP